MGVERRAIALPSFAVDVGGKQRLEVATLSHDSSSSPFL
jgi:hypothetical protein